MATLLVRNAAVLVMMDDAGLEIAPVRALLAAGVKVGPGVDGSASNDAGNLIGEARQALLLQRVALGANAMPARAALRLATHGGAAVPGAMIRDRWRLANGQTWRSGI